MQGGTAKEEGTAAEDDGTAAEASDQEEMMRIEADGGCGSVIRDEVAAQKQEAKGGRRCRKGEGRSSPVGGGSRGGWGRGQRQGGHAG